MNRPNNEIYQNLLKRTKRIALTIVCCIPVLIIFAYLTRYYITSRALKIICFMIIMAVAVAIVEVISSKRQKKQEAKKLFEKDVFK